MSRRRGRRARADAAPGEPWYGAGLRFGCTSCGDCCRGPEVGYVFVEAEDVEAMAAHLELDVQEFGRRYLRRVQGNKLSLTEKRNLDCVFWEDEVGCKVYQARPLQCRQYPFWPEVIESPDTWDAERPDCPGIGEGRIYTAAEVERIAAGRRGTRPGRRRLRMVGD